MIEDETADPIAMGLSPPNGEMLDSQQFPHLVQETEGE